MKNPIVIKKDQIKMGRAIPANAKENEDPGVFGRIVGSFLGDTNLIFGVADINPGFPFHRWHNHIHDKGKGYEINYPKGFEEVYYVVSGRGVVQFEAENGQVQEAAISEGDAVFFPVGVTRHQVFNNGTGKLKMVYAGTPNLETVRS